MEIADRIDGFVGKVRENTSDRLVRVARMVVFGFLALVMGAMAAVLLLVAVVRFLDEMIPGGVWVPYVGLGAILMAIGGFLWSKRSATAQG